MYVVIATTLLRSRTNSRAKLCVRCVSFLWRLTRTAKQPWFSMSHSTLFISYKRFLYCVFREMAWWLFGINYRKRGSASYIVREVHSVREREIQREGEREIRKWRHHCRAKIGDEFCTSPCQKCAPQYWPKFCTSVSHLLKCAEFTLSIAQNVNVALFETVRILRTVKWRDWQGIEAAKHTIKFPAAPFFLVEKNRKNESN